ncbi:MAG: hypothetical protein ACYDBB_11175 [Armatimonadota bacterium]
MSTISKIISIITIAAWALCAQAAPAGFVLQDYLNRTWQNEAVSFPLAGDNLTKAQAGKALVGPDGKAVLYQVIPGADTRIELLTDLTPFEKRTYTFTDAPSTAKTDLKIEETAEVIRLTNDRTGIAIRKQLAPGEGPLAGIRLSSGAWVGDSKLAGTPQPTAYTVEVTSRGPVYAEVVCRAAFGGTKTWSLTVRLQAHEPVALVDETFKLGDGAQFILSLGRNFAPDSLLYRKASAVAIEKFASQQDPTVCTWRPFTGWGGVRSCNWFGLYNAGRSDLLMLGKRDGEVWVDLRHPRDESVIVTRQGDDVVAPLPLRYGQRRWMIGALAKDACLTELNQSTSPLPQQYLIKYEFPLNRVKDYVLEWPEPETHPRLYVTPKTVEKFRKSFKADPKLLAQYTTQPLTVFTTEGPVSYYLGTGDPALGKHLAETAIAWMQTAADYYLKQEYIASLGYGPNHQTGILSAVNLADAVLSSDAVTPEQRRRLRAQAAFIGYVLQRPDYWSPLRGFGANPNLTTHVAAYQAGIGCFIASHPLARTWVDQSMEQLKDVELDNWADDRGGWLEPPTYALAAYNYLLGSFLMTHNSGFNDYLYDPKMKKVMLWLASISTPPDARLKGWRHLPPIGNTYKLLPCWQFWLAASLWKDKDPGFAAQMAWMHQQQGSYPTDVGGFSAVLAGYRDLVLDTTVKPKPMSLGSEWFPETGVVLRNKYPTDRETMLYLIAGNNWQHYDFDSGSITLWGKGRIIADDFGYTGRAPVNDHSMVELPLMKNERMRVTSFSASTSLDYVRATLNTAPPVDENHVTPYSHVDYQHSVFSGWTRQIALVKEADPLGMNYFVICDSLRAPIPATWRVWLTCESVTLNPQGALVVGKEDVDTDVFFTRPVTPALTTETKTRSSVGLNGELQQKRSDWTQIGLIATAEAGRGWTAVVYPRLKTEKPPVFTTLAGGKGVKVQSGAGTDYVFLSEKPFQFKEGDITFSGTVGVIQLRGKQVQLSLGAPGSIAARGKSLVKAEKE